MTAQARRNIFRDAGHPQIGGRVKSSDALIESNVFLHNSVLNQEVSFLQSWLEGPTHIENVVIRCASCALTVARAASSHSL